MTLDRHLTVGQIATEHPLSTRVFARHGIDYCCGGRSALDQAAAQHGLDVDALLQEIHEASSRPHADVQRWDEAPMETLIEHIQTTYHRPLREELPRLAAMAQRVHEVHGHKDPDRLTALAEICHWLADELLTHMDKEDTILFPLVLEGHGAEALGPIAIMRREHDAASDALRRIRGLTDGFRVPDDACATWRALWHGLEALETDMHQHVHLENNVLFPRALRG